jgi:hypothetical protein
VDDNILYRLVRQNRREDDWIACGMWAAAAGMLAMASLITHYRGWHALKEVFWGTCPKWRPCGHVNLRPTEGASNSLERRSNDWAFEASNQYNFRNARLNEALRQTLSRAHG